MKVDVQRLLDDELSAVKAAMANAEHDAGDVYDHPPSENHEDAYWAYRTYHGLRKLLAIAEASESLRDKIIGMSTWSKVMDDSLEDPQWESAGRVHDWRNHVPRVLRDRWHELNPVAQATAFLCASEAADAEEWG